ncbi:MAG: phage integrase central domain-containing protein [Acidimicrobiales bacterium]
MGSIRRAPRDNRRWEARYRDPLGAQRTKTFDTKADARVFLAGVETSLARGTWHDPGRSRTTFAQLAADWLASNPAKRATTYARDATVIRVHLDPLLGALPAVQVKPAHVQRVIDAMAERGLSPKTVRTDYGVLRAVFAWAIETDLIDRPVAAKLDDLFRQAAAARGADVVHEPEPPLGRNEAGTKNPG